MRRLSLLAMGCLFLGWSGCGTSQDGRGVGSGGGGGGGGSDSDGGAGGGGGGSDGGGGGGDTDGGGEVNCGVQNFNLQKGLPPDLLIVLDRSGSMLDPPAGGGGSKWSQITSALTSVVSSLQGQIKWGLEYFPSIAGECSVSTTVDVAIAANNGAAINASIAASSPNGGTPTADAVADGAAYLGALTDANPKYIVLATDGDPACPLSSSPSCTCLPGTTKDATGQCCVTIIVPICTPCISTSDPVTDAAQAVTDAAAKGIHTFVVGIGTDATSDATLNTLAENGGEARPGTTKYYPVGSASDFTAAINTIAGQIISCSFALTQAPDYPDYVGINADGQKVPKDTTHTNGWDFGPGNTSIQFYGDWCDKLQGGQVSDVQAIFGCGPIS